MRPRCLRTVALLACSLGLGFRLGSTALAAAPTKAARYQDFTSWYLAHHRLGRLPFRAAAVIEAGSYAPLYYHQERTVIPTASLIKLVTAGVVERTPLDWRQPVSFSAADNGEDLAPYLDPGDRFSTLQLAAADTVSLEQAFATMLIGSANNAADHFANTLAGSRAAFLEQMRQVARDWGMAHTAVEEPTGLSLADTSTAADLARGTCHALEHFIIQYYASQPEVSFTTSAGETKLVKHTVRKLRSNPERFFGAKTGYLKETGYHLSAGFITPHGHRICATILSSRTRTASEAALYELGRWVDQMYRW